MAKILGLDLGTNSIGWALIEEQDQYIIDAGARIFPAGVEGLGKGDGELSKSASRGMHRGSRRQFFRRRIRKIYLLKILSQHGLCPIDVSHAKYWKIQDILALPELQQWVRMNPYELRANACRQKVSLHELGRIFYHMIQRRGFLSNSRNANKKEEGKIYDGDNKTGKTGIHSTQEKLHESTLGSYLNSIYPVQYQPYHPSPERIRNRYTTRQMYADEFEIIWGTQEKYHTELIPVLKTLIGGRKKDGYPEDGALFYQRPLRSQKHLIGNCSLEHGKNRAPASAIPTDLFNIYQWVNTLECNGEEISKDHKHDIVEFLLRKEKVSFSAIRKIIGKSGGEYQFNFKDEDKVVGSATISKLCHKRLFGEKWFSFSEKEQEDIWHVLYSFDDIDKLRAYAMTHWGFDEKKAEEISKFHLKDGYASLSRKAINNILPFLKMGYKYHLATVFGGIKNAFGNSWDTLEETHKQLIYTRTRTLVQSREKGGFIHKLKLFLKEEFQLEDKQLAKLYHHSTTIKASTILDRLPVDSHADKEIQRIKNPVVTTALFELRRLINEIIDLHGKPDEIKIELARDLKVSKAKRNEIRREQQRLEKENDRVKERLVEENQRITHENILKYKLWEECNQTCPYTGKSISLSQLFSNEIQIEHIHPWSRSLNDSFLNKTLCYRDENIKKGNKTPYEYYHNEQGEDKWLQVKNQALSCFKNKPGYPKAYQKFKHFIKVKHGDDFASRQLNDSRYISKEAKNYLSKICSKIAVSPGAVTATLRHKWGMNSILFATNLKERTDHRQHTIDALVLCCTNGHHLQELSKWNRYDKNLALRDFPMPWSDFYQQAEAAIASILTSYRTDHKVLTSKTSKTKKGDRYFTNRGLAARDQLHKDTIYGKRTAPGAKTSFHIRKPVEALTSKTHIDKIVDHNIRMLVEQRINDLGGFAKGGTVPDHTFYQMNDEGQVIPQIYLPNKSGAPVPVKKVRIRETVNKAVKLKSANQYVNPNNNHHVLVFRDQKNILKKQVVSFWEAVERKKQGQSVFQLPEGHKSAEVICSFQKNDMFLLGVGDHVSIEQLSTKEISDHLYKVQKISGDDKTINLCFRKHLDARKDNEAKYDYKYIKGFGSGKTGWYTHNPIKVKISSAGKLSTY